FKVCQLWQSRRKMRGRSSSARINGGSSRRRKAYRLNFLRKGRSRRKAMLNRHVLLLALLATVFCGPGAVVAQQDGYRIVLRSRPAEATPAKCRTVQTGGGWILVEQPEADTIV